VSKSLFQFFTGFISICGGVGAASCMNEGCMLLLVAMFTKFCNRFMSPMFLFY